MNKSFVIESKGLSKSFKDGKGTIDVLIDVDFSVSPGESIAIVGASGSGKSTLLHLLGGLDKPTSGEVFVNGKNVHKLSEKQKSSLRNHQLGFVYQFHHLLPEFSVLENVCMPLLIRGEKPADAKQKSKALLEKVGLQKRLEHKIGELSGGERQRTAIARALVTNPACVLADEPTGNLDHKTADQVFDIMSELNRELATSLIIVTHDLTLAKKMDRTLHLEDGSLQKVTTG